MAKAILNDLKAAGDQLMQTLSSFSEEQINVSPYEGSWTGAQVAEHLLKADNGVLKVLYGATEKTERHADEKAPGIKNMFLDFSLKFKSAEQIMPSYLPQQKDSLLKAVKIKWAALNEAAATLDLSETCLGIEVPTFGVLTRLEWLYLVCFHTHRHIYQLKDLFEKTANYNLLSQKVS